MRLFAFILLATLNAHAAQRGDGLEALYGEVPGLRASVKLVSDSKDRLAALASDPAQFVARKTYLGDAGTFSRFLRDKKAVDGFLADPVTSFVTAHDWAVRQAARPAVVEAVLASPAMRDKKLVSYMFTKTALPLRLARTDGVAQALRDKEFVSQLCTARVRAWLSENPAARAALTSQSPAFGEACR